MPILTVWSASANFNPAAPGPIGGTTPSTGAFTNLSYTGTLTGGTGVINIGSGQIVKDAGGNVGIGTNAPSSFAGYTTLTLNNAANGGIYNILVNGAETARLQAYAGAFVMSARGASTSLIFDTNGTERARIDVNGNMGIGATPSLWAGGNSRGLEVGAFASLSSSNTYGTGLGFNTWHDGTNYIRRGANVASFLQCDGSFRFRYADAGAAGSTITFSDAMIINTSGNLGLGVTPSSWFSSHKALQINTNGAINSNTDFFAFSNNVFVNAAGNDIYLANGFAGRYRHVASNGAHQWFVAPTGTAGNTATLSQIMGLDASGVLTVSATTAGIGYGTGSGGAVTQLTSRTTGVTLNRPSGSITLFSAAGSAAWQSFTVTNSTVAATDVIRVCQRSGTDLYQIHVTAVAAGSFRVTFATTGGTTVEQPVFSYVVIKGVAA